MSLGTTVGSAWSLFLAAVALNSLAVAQDTSPVRAEKEKLKGTWFMEETRHVNAKDRKATVKSWLRLTFTEDKALIETDSEPKGKAEPYKLNPAKSPKELDIGQGETAKELIYKLDGDKLTIAFPFPELVSGGTFAERQRHILRPRDFKETKETAAPIVLVLKRVKQ
ncbi:MAG TPA: TIGR03067 domain-containing protein [Gemmataceae bacterium]|nr:TIGR03067 domain-containing protein [Gemmataceae bacterium]